MNLENLKDCQVVYTCCLDGLETPDQIPKTKAEAIAWATPGIIRKDDDGTILILGRAWPRGLVRGAEWQVEVLDLEKQQGLPDRAMTLFSDTAEAVVRAEVQSDIDYYRAGLARVEGFMKALDG